MTILKILSFPGVLFFLVLSIYINSRYKHSFLRINGKFSIIRIIIFLLWIVVSLYLLLVSVASLYWGNSHVFFIHIVNALSIIVFLILLSFFRIYLEQKESNEAGKAPIGKGLFDLCANIVIFVFSYAGCFCTSMFVIISVILLSIFNIFRVIKFRIYDDIIIKNIYSKISNRHLIEGNPGHLFLRGILDQIPRAYFYVIFSFTTIQLILQNTLISEHTKSFRIENASNNIFVDFFYYNVVTVSTVGYGDISPISPFAKLICSVEILFSIILLLSLVSIVMGRYQILAYEMSSKTDLTKNSNKANSADAKNRAAD